MGVLVLQEIISSSHFLSKDTKHGGPISVGENHPHGPICMHTGAMLCDATLFLLSIALRRPPQSTPSRTRNTGHERIDAKPKRGIQGRSKKIPSRAKSPNPAAVCTGSNGKILCSKAYTMRWVYIQRSLYMYWSSDFLFYSFHQFLMFIRNHSRY